MFEPLASRAWKGSPLYTNATEGLREAVLCDVGFAIVSDAMVGPELESRQLVETLSDWALPSSDVWAVFPAGRKVAAKVRRFTSFLETIFDTSPLPLIAV